MIPQGNRSKGLRMYSWTVGSQGGIPRSFQILQGGGIHRLAEIDNFSYFPVSNPLLPPVSPAECAGNCHLPGRSFVPSSFE